jgi:hypothetical protein
MRNTRKLHRQKKQSQDPHLNAENKDLTEEEEAADNLDEERETAEEISLDEEKAIEEETKEEP